jgi:hypothetical protein
MVLFSNDTIKQNNCLKDMKNNYFSAELHSTKVPEGHMDMMWQNFSYQEFFLSFKVKKCKIKQKKEKTTIQTIWDIRKISQCYTNAWWYGQAESWYHNMSHKKLQ